MKKFLFCMLVLVFSLICVTAVGADGAEPISSKEISSAVSPALEIIAADYGMAKAGLASHTLVFSSDDFCRALNLSKIESITVTSLPDATAGRLLLGTTLVSSGQKISWANLDLLAFSPASDEKCSAEFDFTVADRGYEILVSLSQKSIILYTPSKKCPIVTFSRHRVLGEELRFAPEVYEERREVFKQRLDAILKYAMSESECRSRMLLSYFGDKDSDNCGNCDVCIAQRGAVPSENELSKDMKCIMDFLSTNDGCTPAVLDKLGLTRKRLSAVLRILCDEEKIVVSDGKVRINKDFTAS